MLIVTRNKYVQYDLHLEETNQDSSAFSYFYGLLVRETDGQASEFRDEKTSCSVRLESERFINPLLQAVEKANQDSNCLKSDTNWEQLSENLKKIKLDIQNEKKRMLLTEKDLAQKMFDEKIDLDKAIQRDVFPCVVSIETPENFGTGFFEHNNWLVSNAHVLPNYGCVENANLTNDAFKTVKIDLGEYGSFHRKIYNAPDISIINIASGQKCLPFNKFSSDEVYENSIFFYVYIDHENQERKIGYIELVEQKGVFLTYKCNTDVAPAPGSSGAPVIQAQLKVGRYPQWRFQSVGAIYAKSMSSQKGEMLVHAISPDFDFDQIRREIIIPHDEAKRFKKEGTSTRDQKLSEDRFIEARKQEELALKNFIKYSTQSIITDLPPGLEKLKGPKRKKLEEKKEFQHKIVAARSRTTTRLNTYDTENYEQRSARQLAEIFSELGVVVFDTKNQEHTQTNKTIFKNPNTGWYICYDKLGKYNTVHNENGNYVALDRSVSSNGKIKNFILQINIH